MLLRNAGPRTPFRSVRPQVGMQVVARLTAVRKGGLLDVTRLKESFARIAGQGDELPLFCYFGPVYQASRDKRPRLGISCD